MKTPTTPHAIQDDFRFLGTPIGPSFPVTLTPAKTRHNDPELHLQLTTPLNKQSTPVHNPQRETLTTNRKLALVPRRLMNYKNKGLKE